MGHFPYHRWISESVAHWTQCFILLRKINFPGRTEWKPDLLQTLGRVATEHTHTHPPNLTGETVVEPRQNFQDLKLSLSLLICDPLLTEGSDGWGRGPCTSPVVSLTVGGCGSSYQTERFSVIFSSLFCTLINVLLKPFTLVQERPYFQNVPVSHAYVEPNSTVTRRAYAKQTSKLKCPRLTVHHVYLIPPDGLWTMPADIGLGASAVQIRLALTLSVEKACQPGPCFISPGCITHF